MKGAQRRRQKRTARRQLQQRGRLEQDAAVAWRAVLVAPEGMASATLGTAYDQASPEVAQDRLLKAVLAVALDAHRRGHTGLLPLGIPDADPSWFTWTSHHCEGVNVQQIEVQGLALVQLVGPASGWGALLRGLAELLQTHPLQRARPLEGVLSPLMPVAEGAEA